MAMVAVLPCEEESRARSSGLQNGAETSRIRDGNLRVLNPGIPRGEVVTDIAAGVRPRPEIGVASARALELHRRTRSACRLRPARYELRVGAGSMGEETLAKWEHSCVATIQPTLHGRI